jgi:hypothetical protein
MADRKMTFIFPEDLATNFVRRVPARKRSAYIAEALSEKLAERDRQLISACETANQDPDLVAIEKEMDALQDEITEPWDNYPARDTDASTR